MAMLAGGEKNEKKKQQDTVVQPEQTTPGQTTGAQGAGATTATQLGQNAQPSETVKDSMGQTATPNTTTTTQNKRSATYENAMTTLKKAAGQTPQYSSPYDEEISSLYQQITNREPFKYDYSTDPIYGQYREQYTQMGKQAMRDSMGQTAALTGGYGNSYGSAVGQQQYDAYLQRLNDVLPELYGQAYDIYNAEGNALRQQYALASDMRGTDYNRYRDALSDYRYDQSLEEERARQLASDLGAYGDFSGYGELYGKADADDVGGGKPTAGIHERDDNAGAVLRDHGQIPLRIHAAGSGSRRKRRRRSIRRMGSGESHEGKPGALQLQHRIKLLRSVEVV